MSSLLNGVRIGPLDPDRGENFGQVGGSATARQLIRHHTAMHPPALIRALSRARHDARSESVNRDEAEELIRDIYEDAGEALPEDSRITGYAVRGADEQPEEQALTFTFTTKSGRTGKGFVPYSHDRLSKTRAAGDEAVRIAELKKAGLPWAPSAAALSAAGVAAPDQDDEELRAAHSEAVETNDRLADENADLRDELEELRARLAEVEGQAPTDAQAGAGATSPQTPEGGSADTLDDRVVPEEPWDGYEDAKAQDVRQRLREHRDADLARRVLAWETRPDGGQNRSTVTAAANEVLDHSAAPGGE